MRFSPLVLGVVPAVLLSLAVGCSPSSDSASGTPDAAISPTGTDSGADGGAGDGATSPTCTVLGTNVLSDDIKELSNLSLAGTSLVFLSSDLTLTTAPGIEKIQQDGTGRTTLYTPVGDRRIHSLHVAGDKIFFFETDNAAAVPVDELWTLPALGGTPTRVGTVDFGDRRFIGSDATHLYVVYATGMPVGARFDRIDQTTGVVENVAILTDRSVANQVTLSGNDIFFYANKVGADANVADIFRFDKTASGVTPTILPGGLDALCDSGLGGLYATPTKLACGFAGVNAGGRDGTAIGVVVPKDFLHPSPNILVGTDAETLYLIDREHWQMGTGTIRKVASTGGPVLPVACDVSTIQDRLADGTFPIQTEHEVIIGATDVFWVEHRGLAPDTKWFVRRAPK